MHSAKDSGAQWTTSPPKEMLGVSGVNREKHLSPPEAQEKPRITYRLAKDLRNSFKVVGFFQHLKYRQIETQESK